MPLQGMTLAKNATSAAATGGTSTTFSNDGVSIPNGIHVADLAEADFRIRTHITLKTRNPALQSDGSYSKGKRNITVTVPILLDDGSVSYQVARIELEMHPELTAAEVSNLQLLAAQTLCDSDTANFIAYGSLA